MRSTKIILRIMAILKKRNCANALTLGPPLERRMKKLHLGENFGLILSFSAARGGVSYSFEFCLAVDFQPDLLKLFCSQSL